MRHLVDHIRRAIVADRYVIGIHADNNLEKRDLPLWVIVHATLEADWATVAVRPRSKPNPSIRLRVTLPTGEQAITIWSWVMPDAEAKLVTVFFQDAV